jgi:hypothetical protein
MARATPTDKEGIMPNRSLRWFRSLSLWLIICLLLPTFAVPPQTQASSSGAPDSPSAAAVRHQSRSTTRQRSTPPADFVPAPLQTPASAAAPGDRAAAQQAMTTLGRQGLTFVPNHGQTDPSVRFQATGQAGALFFTPGEVVLNLPVDVPPAHPRDMSALRRAISTRDATAQADALIDVQRRHPDLAATLEEAVDRNDAQAIDDAINAIATAPERRVAGVQVRLEGTQPAPQITGVDPLPGKVNYLIGSDANQWQTDLPTYAGIVYEEVYDGIDLRYDGDMGNLKGTYLVAPGADPSVIRWRYEGVADVRLDAATGTLESTLPRPDNAAARFTPPTLIEHAPVAWQELGDQRVPVDVRYAVAADGSIGFVLGDYDPTQQLIIDPTLE